MLQAKPLSSSFAAKFAIPNYLRRESHNFSGKYPFTGRLSVVVQNGTVLKSGYEEGYFTRKDDRRLT